MLVENKFIYISLPRSASTSFYYSCLINNLKVEHVNNNYYQNNKNIDFNKIDTDNIMNFIEHGHETLYDLRNKFGYELPIIAVRRNRHERFISLYKHILFDFQRIGLPHLYNHFANLTNNDLFFYKTNNLLSKEARWECINDYLIDNNLVSERIGMYISNNESFQNEMNYTLGKRWYINNILDLLLTPISYWHSHDTKIIWFDFDKITEMENWISNMIGTSFNMKKINSNTNIDCKIELNDIFIKKYNDIYDYYDVHKEKITLI
jgi:hypothetical protein